MGRPIKKKYFGNLNAPYSNYANGGLTGSGGEGVASVTVNTVSPTSAAGAIAVAFGAPTVFGGTTATGVAVKTGLTVTSITITYPGSGYATAPVVTLSGTGITLGTAPVAVLNTAINAIAGSAFIPVAKGGSSASTFDIIKQEASRRYLVRTAQGIGQCKLVAAAPAAGEMTMIATDVNGSTYYVVKLTARHATLVRNVVNGSFAFATNAVAGWTVNGAAAGYVSIANA